MVNQSAARMAASEPARYRTTVTLTEAELSSLDALRSHLRRVEQRKVAQSQLLREALRHSSARVLAVDETGGEQAAAQGGRRDYVLSHY